MARKAGPTHEDYDTAARLGLLGLTADEDSDVDSIMEQLAALDPPNTFPAEVLLELAAKAIEESGASPADPINYEGMHDRHLPNITPVASTSSTRATMPSWLPPHPHSLAYRIRSVPTSQSTGTLWRSAG